MPSVYKTEAKISSSTRSPPDQNMTGLATFILTLAILAGHATADPIPQKKQGKFYFMHKV